MYYRTRTYIAGDWDHDSDAVEMLHFWNESSKYGLSFSDAHDLKQARDTSLNCSIKRSLADRLNASKTFVLIVGDHTSSLRAGSCQYCPEYRNSPWVGPYCNNNHTLDYRSYIEFECEKALNDGLNIIVLYKASNVDRTKCPSVIRNSGTHAPMKKWNSYSRRYEWDYQSVKQAFDSIK
jgi:hypothetical protein